ncbi:MAG: HAD hydrolase-like protein [Desulfurococcaceae archaeon]
MNKLDADILSLDYACTLFWEPGCDYKYSVRYIRDTLNKLIEILEKHGFSTKKIGEIDPYILYRSIWKNYEQCFPNNEVWHRYLLLKFFYKLGFEIDSKLLDQLYEYFIEERVKHFTPMYRLDLLLGYLKSRGYELVLTTAIASHDFIMKILEKYDCLKYFKLVFSTQLVGIKKNDERFYRELVDVLNTEPNRILHVGDSIEGDIIPAKKIGLKTIYYGWRTLCRPIDPEPCILDLWEIQNVLK